VRQRFCWVKSSRPHRSIWNSNCLRRGFLRRFLFARGSQHDCGPSHATCRALAGRALSALLRHSLRRPRSLTGPKAGRITREKPRSRDLWITQGSPRLAPEAKWPVGRRIQGTSSFLDTLSGREPWPWAKEGAAVVANWTGPTHAMGYGWRPPGRLRKPPQPPSLALASAWPLSNRAPDPNARLFSKPVLGFRLLPPPKNFRFAVCQVDLE